MKIPEVLKWGFDPRVNPSHRIFEIERGRKLWGILRARHIVNQYFNDGCCVLLAALHAHHEVVDGATLYRVARDCGLGNFGKLPASGYAYNTEPDLEFWQGLYDVLYGVTDIKEEFPEHETVEAH